MGLFENHPNTFGTVLSVQYATAAIKKILPDAAEHIVANTKEGGVIVCSYQITLRRLAEITFSQLEQLSTLFRTKNINFGGEVVERYEDDSDESGQCSDEYWLVIAPEHVP